MSQLGLSDLSDTQLVRLCQDRGAKDERPFQELFHRYQTLVWRVCFSFTNNPQDAEDLTQELFFKVYRSLHTFEGRSSFKTWIYRIAINTCQNEIRKRNSRPQQSDYDFNTLAEALPGTATLETEWQQNQQRQQLAAALVSLPAEVAEMLYLKDIEQRPYLEIAAMLEISVSAAKMRAQRARLALRAAYDHREGGG